MSTIKQSVLEFGYAKTPLDIPLHDREQLAYLGSQVIDLAAENPVINDALQYNPYPDAPGKDITGFFIGAPRVAKDDSVSFHSGWRTKDVVNAKLRSSIPRLLHDFLELQRESLHAISSGWLNFINELLPPHEAKPLQEMLVHNDFRYNNHHLRVVRYPGALVAEDEESFSAHGDLSLISSFVYRSDKNHVRVAPYPLSDIKDKVDKNRYEHAKRMKDKSIIVQYDAEKEAATMLGFGATNADTIRASSSFEDLMSGYHFGIRPREISYTTKSSRELFGDDCIAVVAFGHPHYLTPYTSYRISTKEACRPEQVYEDRIK